MAAESARGICHFKTTTFSRLSGSIYLQEKVNIFKNALLLCFKHQSRLFHRHLSCCLLLVEHLHVL